MSFEIRGAPMETTTMKSTEILEEERDRRLDEALELTFPASDPIAVSPGRHELHAMHEAPLALSGAAGKDAERAFRS
jgi:hypothetical protein